MDRDVRELLKDLFYKAIEAVDPYRSIMRLGSPVIEKYCGKGYNRIFLLAFGKAAPPMAKAIEDIIGNSISQGIIITKYGHSEGYSFSKNISVYEASHPVPDLNGLKATSEALKMINGLKEDDLVFVLISGGGSALLVSPVDGITLEDKISTTDILLRTGADIFELNTVRKKLSRVKGGKLAKVIYPASAVSFILSDVLGDRLDMIASGPTVEDTTTVEDALKVFEKYNLFDRIPENVIKFLHSLRKVRTDLKENEGVFKRVENIIVGSNTVAIDEIYREVQNKGLKAEVIDRYIQGEAKEAGERLAEIAIKRQFKKTKGPLCLISGGETTVTVKGSGKGGRNTELALSFAINIKGKKGIYLLSAGTDGTDGPTDAAGAIVDGETVMKGVKKGLDPTVYLENNDSYTFLRETGDLLITGPTGTNVMDIQIIIIDD